jgi:hypothetical protein
MKFVDTVLLAMASRRRSALPALERLQRSVRTWRAASASALLAMLLAACTTASDAWPSEDGFFIDGAALADPDYLARIEAQPADDRASDSSAMGLFAHRVSGGQGTILGYRAYSPGGLMTVDDESFEKVTIWFKQGRLPLGTTPLRDETVVVIHTFGGSAWPRMACSAVVVNGAIDIARSRDGFDVTLRGDLGKRGNRHPDWCERERIDLSFRASEIALTSLTPWLGSAGDHPYDESYRR